MSCVDYIYSQGNRLEDRNTYFYTQFSGEKFLNAWREAREHAARDLHSKQDEVDETPPQQLSGGGGVNTRELLKTLMGKLSCGEFAGETRLWTNILRRRFEVSKRVFCTYAGDYPHKPVPGSSWQDLELYTGFAALMDAAYNITGDITCLNALLKCNDTLVSVRHVLSAYDRERLSDLLDREAHHIGQLADSLEVRL